MLDSVAPPLAVHPDHGRHMVYATQMVKIMIPMRFQIPDRSVTFLSMRQPAPADHLLSTGLRDCLKTGGQAAITAGGDESFAGWNFCP